MTKILPLVIGFAALYTTQASAQHIYRCGQTEVEQQYLNAHPEEADQIAKAERDLEEFTKHFEQSGGKRAATKYIIPTVFHIIHNNGPENVSDVAIKRTMVYLNDFFEKRNATINTIVPPFDNIIGDGQVEFRLAKRGPLGQVTNGIQRFQDTRTTAANDNIKGGRQWPRNQYLNVYIVNDILLQTGTGTAGYTYRPGSVSGGGGANIDGLVVEYNWLDDPEETTLAHEVGHWINLSHTWGGTNTPQLSSNCNSDDGVSDTPRCIGGPNISTCDFSQSTCGSVDNVQNIMDYTGCSAMFTQGQVTRMQAALESNTASRRNLWQPSNLTATGVADLSEVDFRGHKKVLCVNDKIEFDDQSQYGATTWNWTFSGGTPATSQVARDSVLYPNAGIFRTILTASQGATSFTAIKNNSVFVVESPIGKGIPYDYDFNNVTLPGGQWFIDNEEDPTYGWKYETSGLGFDNSDCIKLNNFQNPNTDKPYYLYFGSYDLSTIIPNASNTDAQISFDLAYNELQGVSNEKLELEYSIDCGTTWDVAFFELNGNQLKGGTVPITTEFVPSSNNDFRRITSSAIRNFAYTENVIFRFKFTSKGGNSLYIDNFNIRGLNYNQAPGLISPMDGSNGVLNTLIDWKSVPNVNEYEWMLSTDTNFIGNLQMGTNTYLTSNRDSSDTEELFSNLSANTVYFWKVRSKSNGTSSDWSETWSFKTLFNLSTNNDPSLAPSVSIFPNPSNGSFTLNLDAAHYSTYSVIGLNGKLIYNGSISNNSTEIDGDELPKGIYFIRVTGDQHSNIEKVVIK